MRKMAKMPPPQRRRQMPRMPQMAMTDNDRDDQMRMAMRMPMHMQGAPKLSALKHLGASMKYKKR